MSLSSRRTSLALALTLIFSAAGCAPGRSHTRLKVAWSTYAGYMPWSYAGSSGILDKWAAAYGLEIELVHMGYIESVEALTAGEVDAAPMSNLECLTIPAASGVDTTVIFVGDYSNGNDAILTRGLGLDELPGHTAMLAAGSVSHYLLVRALELQDFFRSEVEVVDVSDAEIGDAFLADRGHQVAVTWNPIVMQIERGDPGVERIFSSANLPGEILDVMAVRSEVLADHPELGEALTGAWYEIMDLLVKGGSRGAGAVAAMAEASGDTVADFEVQLDSTAFYYDPAEAADYLWSTGLQNRMSFIVNFCLDNGFFGEGSNWSDAVGIRYPDGTVHGNAQIVKMRFDDTYMLKAAEGRLALDWRRGP